jgi:hypothetical protein
MAQNPPMQEQQGQGLEALRSLGQGAGAQAQPVLREKKVDKLGRAYATGKRKNAVARVWLKPGKGTITVNGRDWNQYFARPVLRMLIDQPFLASNRRDQYDVVCTVVGGGLSGQAGAPRHQQGADLLRAGTAPGPQAGRIPHARCARGRAQEIRPRQGAPQLPVLEALESVPAAGRLGGLRAPVAFDTSERGRIAADARLCQEAITSATYSSPAWQGGDPCTTHACAWPPTTWKTCSTAPRR